METSKKLPENTAAWRKRRRSFRKVMALGALGCAVFMAPFYWLGLQEEQQMSQAAADYQQDCTNLSAHSPNCQTVTMQVYEHREEGALDPDADTDCWLGLQSKSRQRLEADALYSQWQRVGIGDTVTATVWNGEVEEITDSGGNEYTKTNPVLKQQGRASRAEINILLAALLGLLVLYLAADSLHEQYWLRRAGNNAAE